MPRAVRRSLVLIPLLALVLPGWSPAARAGQPPRVTIFFDTHMHGSLTGPNDVTFAHYAGLIEQQRATAGPSLFLGAGDELAPSPMSSVFKGAHMIAAYNAAGLDATTYGNHDFDYGPENLAEQVRASRFTWVSANVLDRRTGDVFAAEAGARRFVIKEAGGVRVGVTGVSWQFLAATAAGPNVQILDAAAALRTVVPEMRAAGAQVVIVMSHMCGAETESVAAAVRGIDAMLGDHCAERLPQPKVLGDTIVARRGDEFDALGALTLRVEDGHVAGFSYQDFEITKDLPQDAAVAAVIADYQARMDVELQAPIGETAVALDARTDTVRRKESNLGDYLADALRAWGEADVAVTNGGGIRGNKEYGPGVLTRGDIVMILPFNNTAVLLRISGAALRAALENGVGMLPAAVGRFPQVSGLAFGFDPDAAPGSRVLSVTVGGAPLDEGRSYTLVTNDFMAGGGDGYEMFKQGEVIIGAQAGPLLSDLLAAAIQRDGTIAPREEGRIVIGR